VRGLALRDKNDQRGLEIREIGRRKDRLLMSYLHYLEGSSKEVVANTIICRVHQANYLLDL
jgi:hypothetical protein